MSSLPIGKIIAGGYLAAFISENEDGVITHGLIVAEKSTEFNSNHDGAEVVTDNADGPANHSALLSASSPAALTVESNLNDFNYGGYNDWFIPSELELAAIYWEAKPTSQANTTASGSSNPSNPLSVPQRPEITDSNIPLRTNASIFQESNSQAFDDCNQSNPSLCTDTELYLTSYKPTTTNQKAISFGNGFHETSILTIERRVRAIRRATLAELFEIPETEEELWAANFSDALGAPPQTTALIRATDSQTLADHNVQQFINQPRWYRLRVPIPVGELDNFRIGTVRKFRQRLPGLENGKLLRIHGRQGSTGTELVTLLCRG